MLVCLNAKDTNFAEILVGISDFREGLGFYYIEFWWGLDSKMTVEEVSDGSSAWSRDDDIAFERALASYTDESEEKWEKIAADVPGKSVEQIKEHYELLVEDVSNIESGCVPLPSYGSPQGGSTGGGGDDGGSTKKGGGNESNQGSKAKADQERRKGIAWTEDEHR